MIMPKPKWESYELSCGSGYSIYKVPNSLLDQLWDEVIVQYTGLLNEAKIKTLEKIDREFLVNHHIYVADQHKRLSFGVFDRTLKGDAANRVVTHSFIEDLTQKFNFKVSDSYSLGYPTVTWRLTRPNHNSDFRPLHRDSWFRLINNEKKTLISNLPPSMQTIKIWISLSTTTSLSGLLVVPKSQSYKNVCYSNVERDGLVKPLIDPNYAARLNTLLVGDRSGEAVLFGEDLIHGGAPNLSGHCRISVEIPLCPLSYKPNSYKMVS